MKGSLLGTHKKEQNNEMRTENNYRCNYKINFDKFYKVIVSYRWFLTAEYDFKGE